MSHETFYLLLMLIAVIGFGIFVYIVIKTPLKKKQDDKSSSRYPGFYD